MQKARHHGTMSALTACRRTVSGTVSLPFYGCGTCPLSVSGECLALADGPAGFTRGSTCPALLRIPLCFITLRVPDYHRLWCDFPDTSPRLNLATPRSYNPAGTGIPAVWALPRSLATTGGITFCFLFLRVCASPELFAACRALHRLPEPQASAVRPFLLSPAPCHEDTGRIPWNLLLL